MLVASTNGRKTHVPFAITWAVDVTIKMLNLQLICGVHHVLGQGYARISTEHTKSLHQ